MCQQVAYEGSGYGRPMMPNGQVTQVRKEHWNCWPGPTIGLRWARMCRLMLGHVLCVN